MTYSEQISEFIKKSLINGELHPGQRIKEVELAKMLSISRAPIREALNLLVKDGLIINIPQKGKFVRSLSPSEIKQKYFMGGVLEAAAVSNRIEDISVEDIAKLELIVDKMDKVKDTDPNRSDLRAAHDYEFHAVLTNKTHHPLCVSHARNICERMSKFLLVKYWVDIFTQEEIVARHRHIIQTVKNKDKWCLEEVLRDHYQELGKRMSQYGNIDGVVDSAW